MIMSNSYVNSELKSKFLILVCPFFKDYVFPSSAKFIFSTTKEI